MGQVGDESVSCCPRTAVTVSACTHVDHICRLQVLHQSSGLEPLMVEPDLGFVICASAYFQRLLRLTQQDGNLLSMSDDTESQLWCYIKRKGSRADTAGVLPLHRGIRSQPNETWIWFSTNPSSFDVWCSVTLIMWNLLLDRKFIQEVCKSLGLRVLPQNK